MKSVNVNPIKKYYFLLFYLVFSYMLLILFEFCLNFVFVNNK